MAREGFMGRTEFMRTVWNLDFERLDQDRENLHRALYRAEEEVARLRAAMDDSLDEGDPDRARSILRRALQPTPKAAGEPQDGGS